MRSYSRSPLSVSPEPLSWPRNPTLIRAEGYDPVNATAEGFRPDPSASRAGLRRGQAMTEALVSHHASSEGEAASAAGFSQDESDTSRLHLPQVKAISI
jgi:hypothetical protein